MHGERPNILFIMADQMAAPVLSMYGGRTVKTPHLDSLAEQGVVFESAYCNSPLCAPSRYALMSGRLPSRIGAYDNAADFPADIPTYAHYLRNNGYRTVLAGKMHFCGPDQLHGFEERLTTDIYPADYGWFPDWDDFDQRASWYHNMSSVTQAGPTVRSNQLDFDEEVMFQARRFLYDHVRGRDSRSFCLTVSMTHPHDPYAITEEYWNRYSDSDIELPSIEIAEEDQDPHSRRLLHVYRMERDKITDQQIRNARRAYYGAISYVDDQIGRLLTVLNETGLDENTIVIFSGDHGDMLGERGLWYKMSFFEWSVRVPMLVHAPRLFRPNRVAASVSTMDLMPTLAELTNGGTAPEYATPVEGRSLVPYLRGESAHNEVLAEYMGEGALAPIFMIRRRDWKFICSSTDPDQLFNLWDDPKELVNLAQDPAHADILAGFQHEASMRWNFDQIRRDVVFSQKRRKLISGAHKKGRAPVWDHQPFFDAAQMYMRNHIDLDDLEKRARFPQVDH